MSGSEDDTQPHSSVVSKVNDDSEELVLARDVIELESQKIELEHKSMELFDAQDKRSFEITMKEMEKSYEAEGRNSRFAFWALAVVAAAVICPIALFLYMAFWGDGSQGQLAISFLKHGSIGVAGYGIITVVVNAIKTLFKRNGDE